MSDVAVNFQELVDVGCGLLRGEEPVSNGDVGETILAEDLTGMVLCYFDGDEHRLRDIRKLIFLREVYIVDSPSISKTTIGYLQQLPKLEKLSLHGSAVGRDCVPEIQSLSSLRVLILGDTKLTIDEMRRLASVMKFCNVFEHGDEPPIR